MRCPNCGSENHIRYRSPKTIKDVTVRRHRCQDCRSIFATAEVVVEPALAGKLAEEIDR